MIKNFTNIEGKQSGIYKIVHVVSGKIYIGSAVCFNKRFNSHLADLKFKKHANICLQNAYNKHENNDFKMFIVEICEKSQLLKREQYYLNKYFDNQIRCFNIASVAGSRLGIKTKSDKTAIANKKNKSKFYDVKLINGNNEIVGPITNIAEFCRQNNIDNAALHRVLKGKKISHKNWRLLENKNICRIGRPGKKINIKILSPRNELKIITDLSLFSKENGLDYSCVHKLINGKLKSYKKWKLLEEK